MPAMPASSGLVQNLCIIRLGITNACELVQLPQSMDGLHPVAGLYVFTPVT